MRRVMFLLIGVACVASSAHGQTLKPMTGFEKYIEADLLFKNAADKTLFTRKLPSGGYVMPDLWSASYEHTEKCWNNSSPCVVAGLALQIYVNAPWLPRTNVSRFFEGCTSQCVLPPFAMITAKPGEPMRFEFNRVNAQWNHPPSVVTAGSPPTIPPTAASKPPAASPDGTEGTEVIDANGAKWTAAGGKVYREGVIWATQPLV